MIPVLQNVFYSFSSENDILRELEELSLEAQGIRADREAAPVKVKDVTICALLLSVFFFLLMFWELHGESCDYRYVNSFYKTGQREEPSCLKEAVFFFFLNL